MRNVAMCDCCPLFRNLAEGDTPGYPAIQGVSYSTGRTRARQFWPTRPWDRGRWSSSVPRRPSVPGVAITMLRDHVIRREADPADSRERSRARFPRYPIAARPASSLIDDQCTRPAVRRRDRAFRTGVALADLAGTMMVVGLLLMWLPAAELSWTVLFLPMVVPVVHAANGLYERDARVINKSTLDEVPTLFRAATMATVISYLIQSGVLAAPLGAKVVGSIWLGLTVCMPACRVFDRAAVRDCLSPERVLVIGDQDYGRRLAAKLDGHGK